MDELRKAFEQWCEKRAIKSNYQYMVGLFDRLSNGDYAVTWVDMAWEGWQASRATIEIIAPKFIDSREALDKGYTVDYSNGFGDAMNAYEAAIRAAGIKVKE
ncbi:hypothetical protein A3464_18795 [Enterobacter genomosp. O]|uniref:hypothetical protein n=1 Tax=Enterobacter genomosp. O TaxID=2364150 RepID=UPI0007B323C9|nr:hypothetical protein [Enterobacter genomosp. O]KZQ38566.1 hypothetical protein A3464_18795 [Enterobacter genomosp. O]